MTWKQKLDNSKFPCELFFNSLETKAVKFKDCRLAEIETKENDAIACRIIKDGRIGLSTGAGSISFDRLYAASCKNTAYGKKAHFSFVPGEGKTEEWSLLSPVIEKITHDELISRGQALTDRLAKELPDYNSHVYLSTVSETTRIMNTSGINRRFRDNGCGLGFSLDKTMEGDMIMFHSTINHLPTDSELEKIIVRDSQTVKLCENIVSLETGKYPVLFHPVALTYLWEPLFAGLNGYNIQDKISPLKAKLGEKIFSEKMTMTDDPTWLEGDNRCYFDDEGVLTRKNVLVEKGILLSHLHNLDTAGRLGTGATGNGFRKNWLTNQRELDTSPRIMPTNRIVQPGNDDLKDMMSTIDTGLLLWFTFDCWIGNLINGDFSGTIDLGFKIDKGKPVGRIKNMRISGNIYDLFGKQLVAISKERMDSLTGYDLFPHILCKDVSLA